MSNDFLAGWSGTLMYRRARRYPALVWHFSNAVAGWRRYETTRPLTIVILGMHRSGTSAVTRMISSGGASLGVPVIPANASNPLGHWEAAEGLEINDHILKRSGGSWFAPPGVLKTDAALRWKMRGFLGRLHRQGTAVWKDPRTVLTFPLWRPMLQNHRIVAVFRHPVSVANSLKKRDRFDLQEGLTLWWEYNRRLIDVCEREPQVHWVDFDQDPARLTNVIGTIVQDLGLPSNEDMARMYAPEIRTADDCRDVKNDRVMDLYARLQANVAKGAA